MQRTIKLVVAYEGTGLVGFQRQAEGVSVQGLLEDALARLEGGPVRVAGAGRTDAGVHATGQVASARIASAHDLGTIGRALNAMLPPEVRVLSVAAAPEGFHARFSAVSKTYEYRLLNGPLVPPALARTCWHVPYPLDADAMRHAAALLEGEHDFAGFQSTGGVGGSTVRRLLQSELNELEPSAGVVPLPEPGRHGRLLVYRVTGTGFLRHMVRAIVGTLVEVGTGRFTAADLAGVLASGDRASAGPTAPACGLCLAAVHYEDQGPGPVAAV